jgi:hypothetical protein
MREKMRRCFSRLKSSGLQLAGGLYIEAVVEHDGPEHEALGVEIAGQALIEGYGSR